MPIYKGNTKIGAIYKGTTPISAIYKGSTLIFSSYTWQEWYVEYIYNTLVPTTINSKNVLDKAKVYTIYGNSVVENQLVNTTDTSITLGTHKYLTYISGTWSIITGTSQTLSVSGGTDMIIDLTQRYPFNTPTTLTDTRVQEILNRGYIPYNTGTLKNVDMSEVSSTNADTTLLQTLSLKYQGSGVNTSHDTMVIYDDNVVFTKNMSRYTFSGSETNQFIYDSNYHRFFFSGLDSVCYLVASASTLGNAMCELYPTAKQADLTDHSLMLYSSATNKIVFRDTNYSSVETFLQHITNMKLTYQLATPQVITIPRKHIGVVDLGSLNYGEQGGGFSSNTLAKYVGNVTDISNIYCSKYLTMSLVGLTNGNLGISVLGTGAIWIKDRELTISNINTKLSGQYLYYETTDESTIPNIIGVQSGGTITTNSEVLPNIDFELKAK